MSNSIAFATDQVSVPVDVAAASYNKAIAGAMAGVGRGTQYSEYGSFMSEIISPNRSTSGAEIIDKACAGLAASNAIAKAFRSNARQFQTGGANGIRDFSSILTSGEIAKSVLDVGTQTNLAQVTGGQTLGYVSLDTQLARATQRPNSFSLYQALRKSRANQITDYWGYIDDTGGGLPGTAFQGFGSVSTGILATSTGNYSLQEVNLKLMVNGRAMTTALAAQNSFLDIAIQESTNAALTILQTADYALYYGNATLFPNQFNGLVNTIPVQNQFDFQAFYASKGTAEGWSQAQALYNLIYEVAGQITSYGTFGRITHAFMSPAANTSLQSLITTTLNNIVSIDIGRSSVDRSGVVVQGDLQGMNTRFGLIQFVLDLYVGARDRPAQAYVSLTGTTPATTSAPTNPATVTLAVATAVSGSGWTTPYTTAPSYVYAVASLDSSMNESVLTYSAVETAIASGGSVTLTIAPPAANDAYAFRVYRSGNGYSKTGANNTPYSFRYIGTVLANGSSNVTYTDLNTIIPGGETVFLLDLAEEDNALDFRVLLPLTKVELFSQNLYMPWAVTMIGALRTRIPRFHAFIKNYVPDEPNYSPLSPNN